VDSGYEVKELMHSQNERCLYIFFDIDPISGLKDVDDGLSAIDIKKVKWFQMRF